MSDGYTKLFSDIVDSSIWEEPPEVCKVWVTLLALSDADGFVRGSINWLASKAKVSVEQCTQAVDKFLSPDQKSRTESNQGRRISKIERGWIILNYSYFRNEHKQLSTNPRRVYQREWMRKKRVSTPCQQNVNKVNPASASAYASESVQVGGTGEGYSEHPSLKEVLAKAQMIGLAEWKANDWFNEMQGCGWLDYQHRPVVDWTAVMTRVRIKWESDGRPMSPPKPRVDPNGHEKLTRPMDIKAVIQAKETKAAEIKNKHCSETAIDQIWSSPEKKKEYFDIKREVKALNNQLSNLA